jgi:hypothetical protein
MGAPASFRSPKASARRVSVAVENHVRREHDLVDELHLLLYPLSLGGGKRLFPEGVHTTFRLKLAKPYPSGVVGLHYERDRK